MAKKRIDKIDKRGIKSKRTSVQTNKPLKKARKPDMTIAIVALILNIIVAGLGSLIGGKTKEGVWQVILLIIGAILSTIVIGIPILIVAWIWGIVTGVQLIQEAQ